MWHSIKWVRCYCFLCYCTHLQILQIWSRQPFLIKMFLLLSLVACLLDCSSSALSPNSTFQSILSIKIIPLSKKNLRMNIRLLKASDTSTLKGSVSQWPIAENLRVLIVNQVWISLIHEYQWHWIILRDSIFFWKTHWTLALFN